ncbi:LLM class flavin-dependent oxidoreductase [Rothia aerolata]|uniref:Alkanal monooxygenase n=1 Tax=Rothia aerolata TaxID=1812262 RepID=A0A917IS62_9MICC|nr:LLM class flavin-dependent oxidoreductase [Rothia aerolata]GGH61140.1 alkanal monooxygenase [Rothia aerolata]
MTKIGFLSFGHWADVPGSRTPTASDMLHQAIDLAVGAEEVGVDGAFFRVHHFAQQQASPFPLLSAIASRTSTLELGTGVIDMRYENPLYMAENAAMTDLIAGNERLQLGISRGSPETVIRGFRNFGYTPAEGQDDAAMAREHTAEFLRAIEGEGFARNAQNPAQLDPIQPQSPGLRRRIWWGAGSEATARWTAQQGMNLMSSTLLFEEKGIPFDQLQAQQIEIFRDEWKAAGHDWTPRVSVSRSIIPVIDRESNYYFGLRAQAEGQDQVGYLDNSIARFGRSYIGSPEKIAEEIAQDAAVQEADTVLITVPNQLGVDFNLRSLESIVKDIKPAMGN